MLRKLILLLLALASFAFLLTCLDGRRGTPTRQTPGRGDEEPRRRCAATTQSGTRCSRNAKPGSRFCWQHEGG